MPLRIERIFIRRTDPLKSDLDLEPRSFNLIYGRNEAGKTLVTEFLIRCLFKAGSGWRTRKGWKPGRGSRIVLSGLEEESISFSEGKPWLEDYFSRAGTALHPDLCRLMIVKGGATRITDGVRDPVDRECISKVLSREDLLEDIRSRIPGRIRDARVENGEILGPGGTGVLDNRKNAASSLFRIDSLLERSRMALSGAGRAGLVERLSKAETACMEMEEARNNRAFMLEEKRDELTRDLASIPASDELNDALADMKLCSSRLKDLRIKRERAEELRKSCRDLPWLRNVLDSFEMLSAKSPQTAHAGILSVLMYAGFVLSAVLFLLDLSVPGVICLLVAVAAVFARIHSLHRLVRTRILPESDRKKIEMEFESRFSMDIPDTITMKTMLDGLEKRAIELDYLDDEIGSLERGSEELLEKTDRLLAAIHSENTPPERITHLRNILARRSEIETAINELQRESAELGASGVSSESSSLEWNRDRLNELTGTVNNLIEELKTVDEASASLAREMSSEIGNPDLNRLEDLMHALIEKREIAAGEYRSFTAEIIAKTLVFEVVEDQSKGEDEALRRGMQSGAVARNLHLLTGYSSIDIDENGGLLLGTNDGAEPFALRELSTGTIEQVLLSLRLGLLVDILKEPAFLILDDAFQHSDWLRRERMAEVMITLIEQGWQIICLTMDDHIRDLLKGIADSRLSESEFLFTEL